MAIANGYLTLAEFKARYLQQWSYTASTISFVAATKTIADSAKGLKRFRVGDYLVISGSSSNNGYYTVTAGDDASSLTVSETLVNEGAGRSVTIALHNDLRDDATIERIIEGVSRMIDRYCGRRFYTTSEDEARYYTADDCSSVYVGDLLSVTELYTDQTGLRDYGTAWDSSDYELYPPNAALDGYPYMQIRTVGSATFPLIERGIKIVGRWGFATCPTDVSEACYLHSLRLFRRQQAPFGVSGSAEMGQAIVIPTFDPDVRMLLNPWRRLT